MTIELAPLTLGVWEAVVRALEGDPDDLLFGREELAEGAASLLVVLGAQDVPAEVIAEALPALTRQYVCQAQRHAEEAMRLAAFYAERSGGVGSGGGSEISLARLLSREKPSDWYALRTMPLKECLLYLFMRGVDSAAETWND